MIFLAGFITASVCWIIAAWFAYCAHMARIQVALNLPAASSHAHLTDRLNADKGLQRGPWR